MANDMLHKQNFPTCTPQRWGKEQFLVKHAQPCAAVLPCAHSRHRDVSKRCPGPATGPSNESAPIRRLGPKHGLRHPVEPCSSGQLFLAMSFPVATSRWRRVRVQCQHDEGESFGKKYKPLVSTIAASHAWFGQQPNGYGRLNMPSAAVRWAQPAQPQIWIRPCSDVRSVDIRTKLARINCPTFGELLSKFQLTQPAIATTT